MLSHKGEAVTVEAGFMAVEAGFMAAEAGFVAVEAFTVAVDSEVLTAAVAFTAGGGSQAFMAGVVSGAFIGAILGTFTAAGSPGFTVITVFLATIAFSVPASMGTRDGVGIGVIPTIGVTRITLTTPTIHTTRIIRTTRISQDYPVTLRE
jgi:hypothetical protein